MRKRIVFSWVLSAVLIITVALAAGCSGNNGITTDTAEKPVDGGVLRCALQDDPMSLDPAQFGDELAVDVGKEIYDGLVEIDFKTNKVVSAHAEKWDIKDNKIYTFVLQQDARFHNGREVTAEDFRYSFDRLLDPKTASLVSWVLSGVKGAEDRMSGKSTTTEGIRVIDKYTLEIVLEAPNPSFLSQLAHPGAAVVDRETIEKAKASGKTFASPGAAPELVVGSGPFKFSQWVPKNVLKIVRNNEYYGTKAYLDGVDFKIIPDDTTTLNEFRAGNLDFTDRVPPGQAGVVEREFAGQVIRNNQWQVEFFALNVANPPFINNPKLRQAMNYAVDREGIIKAILEGLGVPAGGILPPGMPEYNKELRGYAYDPAKAKSLLAEAGFPAGQGLPEIDMTYNNNRETNQKIAEAVQAQLKDVGINVKLKGLPLPEYQREFGSGNLKIFRLGWVADSLDAGCILYPLFNSRGDANLMMYFNPEVDSLLEKARGSVDNNNRIELYRQAEQKIVEDAPVISIYHPVTLYLKAEGVGGLSVNPMDLVPFSRLWLSGSKG